MIIKFRTTLLAVGVAAMVSSQAAYAAPTVVRSIDPLVSLSALASPTSRAAVCAGTTAATSAAAAAATTAATAQGAAGCVLPVTVAPVPVVPQAAVPVSTRTPKGIGTLPLLLGLAAIIGLAALILSGNDNGNGDATPVSPA